MGEEPEFVEPNHINIAIFRRWRAAWIEEQIVTMETTENTFAKMRHDNEKVGNVTSLNMYVELVHRDKAMLYGWLMEEKELERQAMLRYEHEKKMREETND